jgi:outer membrane protein assembly factor BamB
MRTELMRLDGMTPSSQKLIANKWLRYALVGVVILTSQLTLKAAEPVDWYQWRGPEATGISREKNLPTTWSTKGENLIWSKPEYASRCTPITMNGKLYIVTRYKPETTEEGEQVVCLDAKTGAELWSQHHNVFLSDAPAERVGWSSVIGDPATGNVFWLGLGCEFSCLNGETGKVLWQHAMSEEYGMLSTYGGRTNFPIVIDDLVIISGVMTQYGENAIPAHRFVAFDKRSGAAVWFLSTGLRPEDTTYSTPFLTAFNGQAAMVFGGGDGFIYAVQPRTGKVIWKYHISTRGINTPATVVDDIVYLGHREQNFADTTILGAIFAFDGKAEGEIPESALKWKINAHSVEGSQPILANGRLYVCEDGGTLDVIDPVAGKIIQTKKVGRRPGSLVFGDGKLYCTEATGNYWVFEPTEEGLKEIASVKLRGEEILAAPIISGGRIYLPTSKALYCIGKADVKPEADPLPPKPQESPKGEDQEVAHIQIAPVEVLLAPGQTTPYQVRAYNKKGQFLKLVPAEFTVEGSGTITAEGAYTTAAGNEHSVAKITAKSGSLTSVARIRIVPPLPWKFEFTDKQVPPTWIGAAYRHQPRDVEGEPMLVKISTIPKGTRSQLWMGWTNFHDYTVQADFFAKETDGKKPDMGLINQRYTLDMMGKDELQLRSWTPRLDLRFAKTIPFAWAPNQWYSMKMQSENKDGKVTLRGKVWKRGEEEPKEWTIEATDATPNTNGSPGLFGNSSLAEYYIDNVQVYANP